LPFIRRISADAVADQFPWNGRRYDERNWIAEQGALFGVLISNRHVGGMTLFRARRFDLAGNVRPEARRSSGDRPQGARVYHRLGASRGSTGGGGTPRVAIRRGGRLGGAGQQASCRANRTDGRQKAQRNMKYLWCCGSAQILEKHRPMARYSGNRKNA